jgi:hypothetical protein
MARGDANEGMLIGTSHDLTAAWLDSQHGLQIDPTPVSIPDLSQAAHLRAMREIQVSHLLHQQHKWQAIHALACLVPMRVHQRIKGDVGFIEQSIHGFSIFPALHLGWQRGGARVAAVTARLVRRMSLSCVCPKVVAAHRCGFRISWVFSILSLC